MKTKVTLSLLTTTFLVSLGVMVPVAHAEDFVIQQLTNSIGHETLNDVDGEKVVWEGYGPSTERQIFFYSGNSIRQLTFDTYPLINVSPRIDGDYIAWIKRSSELNTTYTPQIVVYKISTQETFQITNDNIYEKESLDFSNGKMAWSFREKVTHCCSKLMLYDLVTGQADSVFDTNNLTSSDLVIPSISETTLAWTSGNSPNLTDVFKKDLLTGSVVRLTNNNLTEKDVTVYGNKISWLGFDGTDFEVYLHDGFSIIQVTNNNINDQSGLYLSGDTLVWTFPGQTTSSIGIYKISTQTTEVIEDGAVAGGNNQRIVWFRDVFITENTKFSEVYTKNLLTGEVSKIGQGYDHIFEIPFVSDSLIAWVGEPRGLAPQPDIFIARPGNTPQGTNVTVTQNNTTLTFSQVDSGGNTVVTTTSSGTQPPAGFKLGNPPAYYSISTTATFTGTVQICIRYDESIIVGVESQLKLMHFVTGQGWVDATISLDTVNNIICGTATSFSEFGLMAEPTVRNLVDRVQEMNLQQGIENSLDAKLERAQDAIVAESNNNVTEAVNALQAFTNEVEAQREVKLTNQQANELHFFANNLIRIINGIKTF